MNNKGIIIRGVGGLYSVVPDAGAADGVADGAQDGAVGAQKEILCSARGIFRKNGITPLVGDYVAYADDPARPGYGSVVEISERRSTLRRPPVANVDQLLIVLTFSLPSPDFLLADKLIIHAASNGIKSVICFNKMDLPAKDEYAAEEEGYARAGFLTIRTSNYDKDSVKALEPALRERITILAGQSGVGKSMLFNNILDTRKMEIGDISERIRRGRHTTRHVELSRLKSGGWLVDSPGFSMFDAEIENYRTLDQLYPEFALYREHCKFKECSHIHEPGCAVLEALREGALHAGRHARYALLYKAFREADSRKYGNS